MMAPVKIRQADTDDLQTISTLICTNAEKTLRPHYTPVQWNVFINYYSVEALQKKLEAQSIFCAESDGKLVGTVALDKDFVVGFYTHPDYLNQGVGSALMQYVEQYALHHHITQLQLAASPVGVAFYNKNGWRKIKDITMEYGGVAFAETLMVKKLN